MFRIMNILLMVCLVKVDGRRRVVQNPPHSDCASGLLTTARTPATGRDVGAETQRLLLKLTTTAPSSSDALLGSSPTKRRGGTSEEMPRNEATAVAEESLRKLLLSDAKEKAGSFPNTAYTTTAPRLDQGEGVATPGGKSAPAGSSAKNLLSKMLVKDQPPKGIELLQKLLLPPREKEPCPTPGNGKVIVGSVEPCPTPGNGDVVTAEDKFLLERLVQAASSMMTEEVRLPLERLPERTGWMEHELALLDREENIMLAPEEKTHLLRCPATKISLASLLFSDGATTEAGATGHEMGIGSFPFRGGAALPCNGSNEGSVGHAAGGASSQTEVRDGAGKRERRTINLLQALPDVPGRTRAASDSSAASSFLTASSYRDPMVAAMMGNGSAPTLSPSSSSSTTCVSSPETEISRTAQGHKACGKVGPLPPGRIKR